MKPGKRPEILAPAGSHEALKAAVAAGADAVYFGLERFNARERAKNFTLEELPEIMAFLHLRGVKGYVTFNTLLYESELTQAEQMLREITLAGADAIIVQDLGVAKLAHEISPQLAVHASTQMTITDAASAEVARSLGVTRAIVARELSTKEIAEIAKATTLELEVFVHGALCVAYSGQCFTSASWGGRSANRGECAQACRLPYDLLVDNRPRDLGPVKYLLSPLDLMGIEALPDLARAGVVSFKIEGRLKGPEYVAATTTHYRKALERFLAGREKDLLTAEETRELSQVYSRGGSMGFLAGTNHQTILEGRFPGHRGLYSGAVLDHDHQRNLLKVNLVEELKINDGLLFTAPTLDPQDKKGSGSRVTGLLDSKGRPQEFLVGPGAIEFDLVRFQVGFIPVGAKIYRSNDPVLDGKLQRIISEDAGNTVRVTMQVLGRKGETLKITLCDEEGRQAQAESEQVLAAAQKTPLGEAILREKLGRLGDTPFKLSQLEIKLEDGLHIPISELNRLRRKAVDLLIEMRRKPEVRKVVEEPVTTRLLKEPVKLGTESKPYVVALCRTPEHVEGAIAAGSKEVILDFMELVGLRKSLEHARAKGLKVSLTPPRITKPGEEKILDSLLLMQPDEILVRGLGQLEYLAKKTKIPLRGDFSLNVANAITARILSERGLRTVVPSYDLSRRELELFLKDFPPSRCELVVHQYIPMFHTEYCAYAKLLSPELGFKGTSYNDCGRPCEKHQIALKDRQGAKHPIVVDVGCRNTVFSSQANSVADNIPEFIAMGLQRFRIEMLIENARQVENLIRNYQDVIDGKMRGDEIRARTGAVYRLGVLRVETAAP